MKNITNQKPMLEGRSPRGNTYKVFLGENTEKTSDVVVAWSTPPTDADLNYFRLRVNPKLAEECQRLYREIKEIDEMPELTDEQVDKILAESIQTMSQEKLEALYQKFLARKKMFEQGAK
jgi:hypothetical protein